MKFYKILIDRATKEQKQLILPLLQDFSQAYKTFLYNILRRIINENKNIQAGFLTLLNNSIVEYQHEIGQLMTVPEDISNFICYKYIDYISDYYTMCIEESLIEERKIYYSFIVLKIKIEDYLSHPINNNRSEIRDITQELKYDKFRGHYLFEIQLERVLGKQYDLIQNLLNQQTFKQYKYSLEWFQRLEKKNKSTYKQIYNSNFGLKAYRLYLTDSTQTKKYAQVFQIQQVIFLDELDYVLDNLLKLQCKPQNFTRYSSYHNNLKQSTWVDTQLDPLLSTNPQFNKYICFYKYYKIYLNKKDTLTIRRKFHQFLGDTIKASPFNKGRFKKSRYVQSIINKILQQKNLTNFYQILFHQLIIFIQKYDRLITQLLRLLIVECQRLLVYYFRFRFSIHYFMFLVVVQLNLTKQELESMINKIFDIIANATYQDIQVENYLDTLVKQIKPYHSLKIELQHYQTLNQLDFTFKYISNSLLDTIILFKAKNGGKLLITQLSIEIEFINQANQTTYIPPDFFQNLNKKVKPSNLVEYYMSFQEYREKLCQLSNMQTKTFKCENQYTINDTNKSRIKYERNLDELQKSYASIMNKQDDAHKKSSVSEMNKQKFEYYQINEKMVKYLNMILDFEIRRCLNKYLKHLLIFIQRKFYKPNKFILFLKRPLSIIRWIHSSLGLFIEKFERQLYLLIVGGDIHGNLLLQQYNQKQTLEIRKQTLAQQFQMALNVMKHFQSMNVLLDFKLVLLPFIQDKSLFDSFPNNDDINSLHFNFCCFIIKLFTYIYSDNCIKTEAGFEIYMRFLRKQVELKEINILTQYKSLILSENEFIKGDLLEIISQQFSVQKLCQQVIIYKNNNNIQLNDQEKLFKIKTLVQQRTRNLKKRENKILFLKFYRTQIKQQASLSNILYILQVPSATTFINQFVDLIKIYVFNQMGIQYYDPCPLNVIRLNQKIQRLETSSPNEISHQIQQEFLNFMKGFLNKIIYVSQTQRSGDEINIHQTKTQMKVKDKFDKTIKQCIVIDDSEMEEMNEIDQIMKYSQNYQVCEINKIDPLQLDKLQQKQEQIYRNNFQLEMIRMEKNQMSMNKLEKCQMNINLLLQQKHQKQTNQHSLNERFYEEKNTELYNFLERKQEKYNNNHKNRQISLQNKLSNPTKTPVQISLKAVLTVLREDYKDIFNGAKFLNYNYF